MPEDAHDPDFPSTKWTLVQIVQGEDRKKAAAALEDICGRYWYPVYAYLRRSGRSAHDAEDLTQMLFQKLVTDDAIRQVRQERGRLRNFLIAMIWRVISRQDRHLRAEKRGGGMTVISLDEAAADQRYTHEPADQAGPEQLYDRAWARQVLQSVRDSFRASFAKKKRLKDYELIEPYLGWEDAPAPFAELGARLGSNENAARVLVHRLRKKFREQLEAEVAMTVLDPQDIQEELQWLRTILSADM